LASRIFSLPKPDSTPEPPVHKCSDTRRSSSVSDNPRHHASHSYSSFDRVRWIQNSSRRKLDPAFPSQRRTRMFNLINEQTTIGAQNFSIHFNEEYFPEAEKFMPERFFGDEQKKSKAALNPFSEGPRGCLGRKFVNHQIFTIMPRPLMLILESLAMLEMQIVVPMFFRYFDVDVDESMNPEDMRMKDGFSGCPAGQKVLLNLRRCTS
jgi:hypothetical protein